MPAKNTSPEAVEVGPPSVGMPSGIGRWVLRPRGPVSCTVPSGTCHTSFWVFRSMALMLPNGGVLHGTPRGDCRMSIFTPP
ncbi:hypothetical protein D3C77_641110 [compost metagenome]